MSVPMKPFWALIDNATGEKGTNCYDESILRSHTSHLVAAGTHRIARCVEERHGERRVVQIAAVLIPETDMTHPRVLRTAVCNDGTIWSDFTGNQDTWTQLPPIPQPEPAPASVDLVGEFRALVKEFDATAMLAWSQSKDVSNAWHEAKNLLLAILAKGVK